MGYCEEEKFETFYPGPGIDPFKIELPAGYIDVDKIITDKQVSKICKEIGIKGFIDIPREGRGGGDLIYEIFLGLGINLFSSTLYDSLKVAVFKLAEIIKKNGKKDRDYGFVFEIRNEEKGMYFQVRANVEDKEKINQILDQTREIAKIINKPLDDK